MIIDIGKRDIIWSYLAQILGITSGVIILPLILKLLSTDEIGLNYLMLTVGSLVTLFDFGFAPQFGRNVTYAFSGIKKFNKEGISSINISSDVNYRLVATMIYTARFVYKRLALIVLLLMLTFGTFYIYKVTDGFKTVNHVLVIWFIFSLSTSLNIYFAYYYSLLIGKGLIKDSKKAIFFSSLTYIFISSGLLLSGFGLLGLVIANTISPFVSRYIAYRAFFTKDLTVRISSFEISKDEILNLFKTIWYNSKRLGLVFIGSYAITKIGMFLAGIYLSSEDVASYGLMIQLFTVIATVSTTVLQTYQPKFAQLRAHNLNDQLTSIFSFGSCVFYFIFILGSIFLIFFGQYFLMFMKSNVQLPSSYILILCSFIYLLESNHSNFATLITTENRVPFVIPSLVSGGAILFFSFLYLQYFPAYGILGLLIIQGLVQVFYNNWKWPLLVCRQLKISFYEFLSLGFIELFRKIKTIF